MKEHRGKRHAPTLQNVGLQKKFFWDGRHSSLKDAVLEPLFNEGEMGLSRAALSKRMEELKDHQKRFVVAGVEYSVENFALALASFCETLVAEDAPFDRFRAGDIGALSPSARRGHDLFFFKLNCSSCHKGKRFTDDEFHNIGIGMDSETPDIGRIQVTGDSVDYGAFKTPTLRNVAIRKRFMHDGRFTALEDVLDFYVDGGFPNKELDPQINIMPLDEREKRDLISFLKEGLTEYNLEASNASLVDRANDAKSEKDVAP